MTLASRLHELRKSAGLQQQALADSYGMVCCEEHEFSPGSPGRWADNEPIEERS